MATAFPGLPVLVVKPFLYLQNGFMSVDNVDKSVNNLTEGTYICG